MSVQPTGAESPTLGDLLEQATRRLGRAEVPDARIDAELLMARLLGVDRGLLITRRRDPIEASVAGSYSASIERRERREPLQHIIGSQEFYGLEFQIDGRALVPRPETEGIVDAALGLDLPKRLRVADLGTGSGCIIVALCVERPDLEGFALDISAAALELARSNAARHGVLDRIEFTERSMGEPPADWSGRMDLVVCNPPYIAAHEWGGLQLEVRDHDPRRALVAGPSGLEAYESLLPPALTMLRPEGTLILELGQGQQVAVLERVVATGFRHVETRVDLRGIPRVLVAEKP